MSANLREARRQLALAYDALDRSGLLPPQAPDVVPESLNVGDQQLDGTRERGDRNPKLHDPLVVSRSVDRERERVAADPERLPRRSLVQRLADVVDNTLCPVERARLRDWLAFDEIREQAFQRHLAKRDREREIVAEIIERLQLYGEDATTSEACPDLFPAGVPA